MRESALALPRLSKRSLTTARAITMPALPPKACKPRITSSHSTLVAKAQPADASTYSNNPPYKGTLRPMRSLSGP